MFISIRKPRADQARERAKNGARELCTIDMISNLETNLVIFRPTFGTPKQEYSF